jgi:hypothetical protein
MSLATLATVSHARIRRGIIVNVIEGKQAHGNEESNGAEAACKAQC